MKEEEHIISQNLNWAEFIYLSVLKIEHAVKSYMKQSIKIYW